MTELFICLFVVSFVLFFLWRDACTETAFWREQAVRYQELLYDSWRDQDWLNEQMRNLQEDLEEGDEADWWKRPREEPYDD